ncbi:hypothetical protein Poly24_22730 [Rosistilla carotiformis]|uniref:Uncharacterized protein n=1 Tax=Rosistilla carotiformis TaxID=2528017 RepID=A0A518JSP3_9BACT|nr:hypothetical protein [Rosistilla carotiformis]QDV68563.1 hypothetical protein Poly24_22730 [Rosistilla carotiformis]
MTILDSASLHRFLVHFTDTLTPELALQFSELSTDPNFQQRLDELGAKANEGELTDQEQREYDTYIEAMDVVALLKVKTLAKSNKTG